jgi:hypothetical protein
LDIASPTRWHQCKQESYEGTQLGQIKYIVNYTEQTTEGIQATYMELLVRRAMKRVPGPISCLRLPGTLQRFRQNLQPRLSTSTSSPLTQPHYSTINLSLTDPFVLAQDYPELITGLLRSGYITCVRFNRKGNFLVVGRVDGTVIIFDIETNSVARKFKGYT